jgi:hypothetical protein
MELLERFDGAAGARKGKGAAAQPSRDKRTMESRTHCAYNQTRECFLGLEVKAADLTATGVGELMSARPLKSGEGVWMAPFRGIPAAAIPAPLDLIYLDEAGRVIETVESFPTFQVSSSSPRPDSVLALPAHSIYSSQTQPGDQLVLCVAEEMEGHLQRLNNPRIDSRNDARIDTRIDANIDPRIVPSNSHNELSDPSDPSEAAESASPRIAGAALLREKPLWSGGPGLLELESRNAGGARAGQETYEMNLTQGGEKAFKQPRNWLQRWWSPDPRKAPRVRATGLAAYYWNGEAPVAHGIRDISASGLYVVTEERWYPGTLVLMTLQKREPDEEVAERSIAVQSRAVRWGPDGVGLQFLLPEEQDRRQGNAPILDAAGKKEFERFLKQLKRGR